ncbi:MAG: LysR family transcriptional regulator [Sphingobacteriaceae bacterium]|nr:LysR family transcriptional regulator [Sphingobacteriaceae bacterium]MBK7816149.1 LysR family transcriptional regulator [Sphingobacteriaceae bacterium]
MNVKGRIWLETAKGTFAGEGRITLLERIMEHGSITDAAKSMKMSYRQAWEQIDAMNKQSEKPLVIKVSGGAGGGGSLITHEGKKVIDIYKKLNEQFEKFIKKQSGLV